MIRLIEALNFRCLRYISQPLEPFQILVGPNASGKTTFLDVVSFLSSVVEHKDGVEGAVRERSSDLRDLVWLRQDQPFELAIEIEIPEDKRNRLYDPNLDTVRYEIRVASDPETGEIGLVREAVFIKRWMPPDSRIIESFPSFRVPPDTIMNPTTPPSSRKIVGKSEGGRANYNSETMDKAGKGWVPVFKIGPLRSALGNLPEDETRFPVSTWLKQWLKEQVQSFTLNSLLIRKASPPGQARSFKPDGSNLPWVVEELRRHPDRMSAWIAHLQTALTDLKGIETTLREDDRHRYLSVVYDNGLRVPSWMVSDGTLRMLALTFPAYLPDLEGTFLIEEPENGIHPMAMETVFQALKSVYGAQILLATHSPVIIGCSEPAEILCFKKDTDGATDIVTGAEHPALREWMGSVSVSDLFASGVLG